MYSAERIQTPLLRTGERGSGEFVSISWDEAMDVFYEKIRAVHEEHGTQAVLFDGCGDAVGGGTIAALLKGSAFTFGRHGNDIGQANAVDQALGHYWAINTSGSDDWVNSSTVLVLGSNMVETRLVHSGYFLDAIESGTHFIMIDPVFTPTAGKCQEWHPIEPGTDAALILAMVSVVLENAWFDEDYIKAHTSFPFLVDVETGQMVHGSAEEAPEFVPNDQLPCPFGLTGGYPEPDPTFLVWDNTTNSARYFCEEGVDPALEGVFFYQGRKVTPAFALLADSQKDYSAEWAEEVTGISRDAIYDMAKRFATNGPAVLTTAYGGGDKYDNADVLGHAGLILATITGNIGVQGGGFGGNANDWHWQPFYVPGWPLPEEFQVSYLPVSLNDLPASDVGIHALVTFGDILYTSGTSVVRKEWLDSLDFICIAEVYHVPGVNYADLVLPVCSKFEMEDEVSDVKAVNERLMLRQKVLEPLFESKTDYAIERAMAKRFGLEQYLPPNEAEKTRAKLANLIGANPVSLEDVQANGGVYEVMTLEEPWVGYGDKNFGTPSRRIEAYEENMLSFGQALPRWEPPRNVYRGNPDAEQYPLQLVTPRSRFQIHTQFFDSAWIREIWELALAMNPSDMLERGLGDGDLVEVFNGQGKFKCAVAANNAVRPGMVMIPESVWPKLLEGGDVKDVLCEEFNQRAQSRPYGPVIAFYDTLVDVRKGE